MYWFEKIIPSCCAGRSQSVNKISAFLPDKQKSSSLDVKEDREILKISVEEEVKEVKKDKMERFEEEGNQEKGNEKNQELIDSRRSTGFTATSAQPVEEVGAEMIRCSGCGKEAEGYCPSCPFSRYCGDCFESAHLEKRKFHLFVGYAVGKKKTQKDFENLKKIQKANSYNC